MNGSSSSSTTTTPNFDNLLIHSLMSRLQLQPPIPTPSPTTKSLEDLLFSDLLLNLSDSDLSDEDDEENSIYSSRSQLAKEESRLEKDIVRTILSGETDKLKPNSGQAISIGEHHICVGFHEETGSDYRVWEWHGHIMLFDEENGYTPEYIYGNYFERLPAGNREVVKKQQLVEKSEKDEEEEEEEVGSLGLKELIGILEPGNGHILHRNLNTNSGLTRF